MYKWTAFPFVRLSLCLAFGVVLFDHFPFIWDQFGLVAMGIAVLVAVLNAFLLKRLRFIRGVVFVVLMMYAGGGVAFLTNPSQQGTHYTQYQRVSGFSGVVISDETERDNYYRYEVALHAVFQDSAVVVAQGKIYVYLKKSDDLHRLEYGDVIASNKGYFEVSEPKNPDEFNYKKHLARQQIYAHAFLSQDQLIVVAHEVPNLLMYWAYKIRTSASRQITAYIPQKRERAILTALLLGIKDYLDEDLKGAYASAGAMHVLAVSGLHVGIFYLMLTFLFKPWKNSRYGRGFFVLVAIGFIWLYALVTGFSPSVMRAATMFTVIIISDGLGRRSNIYNSLGIAAMVLILYDPNIIYSVGFQLSFVAVFGIVSMHPIIYRKFHFSGSLMNYLWTISSVSIAAQIATFPLTLLYFHQFPTYFLISNIVVVFAAEVMLGVGGLMLVLGSLMPVLGEFIGFILQPFVWLVNEAVYVLRYLPRPMFDWLYFDTVDVLFVYLIIFFCVCVVTRYRFQYVVLGSLSVLMLSSWMSWKTYSQSTKQRIVFYEILGVTAIDLIKGHEALLLIDDFTPDKRDVIASQVNPHRLANGLPRVSESWQSFDESDLIMRDELFDLLKWGGVDVLMPKKLGAYEGISPLKADFVFFKNSEHVCMNQMMCDQVILGNDFNYYELQSIRSELDEKSLSVHSLSEDGFKEVDLTRRNQVEHILTRVGL